ncbi:sulfur carrier protein ThiS [Acidomonas methanolica]|uniref:Thiamine biosynthesis protein ThiS n=1 Tax=Acidomonas methanolica NBRC 104435 TaxID=1231351 RepID=A0A023D5N7_ACIMT|nr:sulfur carrier protein ThiS [Acidomonas methanolica]MBU2653184.1 sulfur carrier protein ThiS [Acidomonas methanolica]MCQ9154597.1 sulfur carrier protein ThiS [Acidomonas methanolica]TCS32133.1 sulfur carrier protein [Acidomonas methanolica]GAJ29389.1 thiamine biosynthesis protein ThiS [Acidomonas methanolica NBRC 104435]GBQ52954.1 thiamine biosynthesis protein ThiS [Acidomonas methanolica]
MEILVNDERRDVRSGVLADVLAELGFGSARIATAVDGAFVPASARENFRLEPGCRLEIVAPMQGG